MLMALTARPRSSTGPTHRLAPSVTTRLFTRTAMMATFHSTMAQRRYSTGLSATRRSSTAPQLTPWAMPYSVTPRLACLQPPETSPTGTRQPTTLAIRWKMSVVWALCPLTSTCTALPPHRRLPRLRALLRHHLGHPARRLRPARQARQARRLRRLRHRQCQARPRDHRQSPVPRQARCHRPPHLARPVRLPASRAASSPGCGSAATAVRLWR